MLQSILSSYHQYKSSHFNTIYVTHEAVQNALRDLSDKLVIEEVGRSYEGRQISLLKLGAGKTKIFLWSQMHGDEPTATMALFDLLNFLLDGKQEGAAQILANCSLYILPMVNPDGAARFTRRNAQLIDINRDFASQQTPEGQILRSLREKIAPDFGFNLHDQTIEWSAGKTGNPASISLLAPAYDENLSQNQVRNKAMQVIAAMNEEIQTIIPDQVGRFDDEFEPRAFGDNFQKAGTSTILVESGGYRDDFEKQEVRKLVFASLIKALHSISSLSYQKFTTADYFQIPENEKRHFSLLLRNCSINDFEADIALLGKPELANDKRTVEWQYTVEDLGDLSTHFAYESILCSSLTLVFTQVPEPGSVADLIVMDGTETTLSVEKGRITVKNF